MAESVFFFFFFFPSQNDAGTDWCPEGSPAASESCAPREENIAVTVTVSSGEFAAGVLHGQSQLVLGDIQDCIHNWDKRKSLISGHMPLLWE